MKKTYPIYFFRLLLSTVMIVSIGCHVEANEQVESKQRDQVEEITTDDTRHDDSAKVTKDRVRTSLKKQSLKPKKEWGDLQNLKEFSLNDDGVGIVAYNFGKSMEDIQELNGDENAAKEMILYETGAVAYGLSGGKVVDVSEHIEVGDLGDLFSVSSNDLAEHHVMLTVPSEYSGTGKELSTEIVIYTGKVAKVSTWDELDKAMMSPEIKIVDVQNDIKNNNESTGRSRNTFPVGKQNVALLGNGYSVDFIGSYYTFNESTKVTHSITLDNLDHYSTSYYGAVTFEFILSEASFVNFRNVNFHGSQVTASYQSVLSFEGKNKIYTVANQYTSYDGKIYSLTSANSNQAGLECHTIIFRENTDTLIEVENGDAIAVGAYRANNAPVADVQPSMVVEKNANVKFKTLGNTGESKTWNTDGGTIYSVINIHRNGRIRLEEGSQVTAETAEDTVRTPIRLAYHGASFRSYGWQTTIDLEKNSKLNVNVNGPVSRNNAAMILQDNSAINVGENALIQVNAKKMTAGSPVIRMGTNSNLNIAKNGLLSVNKEGGIGNILNLGSNSKFDVSDEGTATFISENETDSKDSMIYGGSNSNFIIGERGNFISRIEDGTGVRNMLNFASNANFTFANARRVDLDARKNTNATLISMDLGTFNASIQQVRAWTKENPDSEEPVYNWRPMYNMQIPYRNKTVMTKDIVASSIKRETRDSFKNNYQTEHFSRVVYDYIPDVKLGVEDNISDNPELTSGQVIKGTVNAGASIAFYKVMDENDPSKDTYLTTPSYNSPEEDNTKDKFHIQLNDNVSDFEFKIPNSVALKAGEKIRVYAFLDGKDDTVIKEVQDKTPPTGEGVTYYESLNSATPLPEKFVTNVKDTNPNNKKFAYEFNKETPQEVVDGYMSQTGEHVVKIDVSDEAGNTATIDATLIVIKANTNLTSKDLSISYKDLRNMSEEDIKQYILKNGKLEAYKLSNGQKEDVTSYISVKDLNGLDDLANVKSTPYNVSLVVSAKDAGTTEDILGEINVTVTDIDSVVTLKFVNEVDKVIDDYTTTIKAKVGDTIDLTQHKTLIEQIAVLNKDGYLIDQDNRPDKETSFPVTDTDVVVTYKIYGTLQFHSVPTELDFGKVTYLARPNRVEKPTYDKNLVVRDTRSGNADGFRVTASVTTPLQTKDGKKLQDVLRYVMSGKETILSEAEEPIYQVDKGKSGLHDISQNWDDKQKSDGIKLQLGSSGDIFTGQYTGEITWKIMEGQP